MKNTFKFLFAFIAFAGLMSCEDEENFQILDPSGDFVIVTPDAGTNIVLDPNLQTNPSITLTWSPADYGTPTEIQYVVEFAAAGTDFAEPVVAASTTNTNVTWNVLELNGAALSSGLTPFEEGGLDIRVKATTGTTGSQERISNMLTIFVTPFSTDLPKLWLPGSYQSDSGYGNNWTQETAATLAASAYGNYDFEGYVYFASAQSAPDNGYKFTDAPNWDNGVFGDDGSFSGALTSPGDNISANPGYYLVKANPSSASAGGLAAMSYTVTATEWGIVGAATPNGWDSSTQLTYNSSTKMWEGIVALTAGEFKFRANQAWTINLGGDPAAMNYDGGNLSVAAEGTYLVKLNLSNPRAYTYELIAQ